MLLRLIPNTSHPTILFTLTFVNLPDGVAFPNNWALQLQYVLQDELEMPRYVHALDKSVWATCLLQEVNFCMNSRVIKCVFIDGTCHEWPIQDERCMQALQDVLKDVDESSSAMEIEQRREKTFSAPPTSTQVTTSSAKPTKHKRSRSLSILLSIVASLVPSSHSGPSHIPPVEVPALVQIPPEPPQSSRVLRRKARAALVDFYRCYVLPELAFPFSDFGYVGWNLHSLRFRIENRMRVLMDESGAEIQSMLRKSSRRRQNMVESATEDDRSSSSTASDASSVHTPCEVSSEYPVMHQASSSDDALINAENGIVAPTMLNGSTGSHEKLTAQESVQEGAFAEFMLMRDHCLRIRTMIGRMEGIEKSASAEREAQMATLEVKARRRAWSSHALLGRAYASHAGLGLPMRSSLLVSCEVITAETLEARKRFLGIPRSAGGRLSGRRRVPDVIQEEPTSVNKAPNDGDGPTELPGAPLSIPPQCGYIPFPHMEEGDDFCSTGPQDPLPLFEIPSECAETSPHSSSDLTGAMGMNRYSVAEAGPVKTTEYTYNKDFDPSTESGCKRFALSVNVKHRTSPRQVAPGAVNGRSNRRQWASELAVNSR